MGYENDPHRDEDGEALMDYDDFGEGSPGPEEGGLLDDDLDDDLRFRSRSPTPVHDSGKSGKSRKRLVKKGEKGGSSGGEFVPEFAEELEDEWVGGDEEEFVEERRKMKGKEEGGRKMKRKLDKFEMSSGGKAGKSKMGKGNSGKEHDVGVREMWDALAADGSEDDNDGVRTVDDDNFIDDSGLDPADRYGSDHERHSPSRAPQAEEGEDDEEIKELFKMGKKRKKNEKSPAEIALLVENVMAELEVTAEEDAELNRQGRPAINKLKKLPLLTDVLSSKLKQLQLEFLDHGVLTLLKNWLEPLPDGSLPNAVIREAILKILTDFPIDLDQYDRKEQLKRSGLGKVIMFLSKSDEETTSNRKLAKELVDKWSRPIFNKSTRFEDMRNVEDERIPYRRSMVKKPVNKSGVDSCDGDEVDEFSRERKSGPSSSRLHASRPEATLMDFVVRPQSKIDPDEIRARAKQVIQDQRRMKMNKKLQQLKAPKKKRLQATKISVEGRGMLKYM